MDSQLQMYYENRLSMMGEPAWKDLMEDIEGMLKATSDISAIPNEKVLYFRQGEISMMRWMLALKETSQDTYEQLQKEDK